jgi:hypothetical protein
MQKEADDALAEAELELREELGLVQKPSLTQGLNPPTLKARKPPTTLSSRNAASALSKPSVTRNAPAKASLSVRKTRGAVESTAAAPTRRYASATAASKNTLGYAQGRAVSQRVRKPLTSVFRDASGPARSASDNRILKQAGDVVDRLRMADLGLDDNENDNGGGLFDEDIDQFPDIVDDEYDDFQFPMPAA